MRVPKEEWIRMDIDTPVDFWKTWGFVRANYCDPMTARGLCPKKCWECEPHLKEAIERTKRPDVRNPIGLLIYTLRDLLGRMQEIIHEKEPLERDRYEPQKDPFDEFLEALDD